MRARGGDDQPVSRSEVHHEAAESNELAAQLRRSATHFAPDLDHRLVQLGLHLIEDHVVASQNFRYIGLELARCWIDDLIFFLYAERQRWRFHETGRRSAMNVGV